MKHVTGLSNRIASRKQNISTVAEIVSKDVAKVYKKESLEPHKTEQADDFTQTKQMRWVLEALNVRQRLKLMELKEPGDQHKGQHQQMQTFNDTHATPKCSRRSFTWMVNRMGERTPP